MANLKASEIHLFIGQMVRVVYVASETVSEQAVEVDDRITPPVLLRDYDPSTHTATFERPGRSLPERRIVKEILSA